MALLTDLPDETLEKVLIIVSAISHGSLQSISLTNRRFNKIAFPLLLRQWSNSEYAPEPPIERLALQLLRHPELRSQVKSLKFEYIRPFHEYDPALVELDPENLAALAEAAAQNVTLPAKDLTGLCEQIRQGCEDAIAVLILTWATRLSYLDITTPTFCPKDDENFTVLLFVKQAICRLNDNNAERAEYLPLGEVRHVVFQHWHTEHKIDMRYAMVFLHLPKITTFTTYGLCDDYYGDIYYSSLGEWREGPVPSSVVRENYTLPLPVGTSTVKEISLTQLEVSTGILDFISACRQLRKLVLHLGYNYEYNQDAPLDHNAMAQVLTQHATSLEELDLIFDGVKYGMYGSWTPIPNWHPVVEDVYRPCCQLRSLIICMVDLFEHASLGDTADYKIVLGRLPKSIEYLKPHCLDIINTWMSNDGCVEPYLEGFIELLEECGLQARFSNLRTLDLSETFVDDPKTTDVSRIKTLAESRGVELLLHKAR